MLFLDIERLEKHTKLSLWLASDDENNLNYIFPNVVSNYRANIAEEKLYEAYKLVPVSNNSYHCDFETDNLLYHLVSEVICADTGFISSAKNIANEMKVYVRNNELHLIEILSKVFGMNINEVIEHIEVINPTFLQAVLLCATRNVDIHIALCDHLLVFDVAIIGKYFPIDGKLRKHKASFVIGEQQKLRKTQKNTKTRRELTNNGFWPRIYALSSKSL
jgi:hypothetical protein